MREQHTIDHKTVVDAIDALAHATIEPPERDSTDSTQIPSGKPVSQ
jgi:hypothetical protein